VRADKHVTGDALAQRYLDLAEKHKLPRCEVCNTACIPDDDGRAIHPTCDPESLR